MALVAPPQSATSRSANRKRGIQGSKEEHRGGHKKSGTGRISNHEFCDSCREGGDLLCCDNCPSAFHFYCQSVLNVTYSTTNSSFLAQHLHTVDYVNLGTEYPDKWDRWNWMEFI